MSKSRFSPEHVATVIQRDFPMKNYNFESIELKNSDGSIEKLEVKTDEQLFTAVRWLHHLLGLGTKHTESNKSLLIMTCYNVSHAEEYKYGLKVFFKEGSSHQYLIIRIKGFKQFS